MFFRCAECRKLFRLPSGFQERLLFSIVGKASILEQSQFLSWID